MWGLGLGLLGVVVLHLIPLLLRFLLLPGSVPAVVGLLLVLLLHLLIWVFPL